MGSWFTKKRTGRTTTTRNLSKGTTWSQRSGGGKGTHRTDTTSYKPNGKIVTRTVERSGNFQKTTYRTHNKTPKFKKVKVTKNRSYTPRGDNLSGDEAKGMLILVVGFVILFYVLDFVLWLIKWAIKIWTFIADMAASIWNSIFWWI